MTSALKQPQRPAVEKLPITQRRFRFNSLGFRLFLVITGGVVAGMGGMSLLFGETVKFQAEDQIKSTLNNKVSTIEDVIAQAETLAYGLNVSVTTLHVRRAETPETYQELVRQLFQGRPEFVTGLGFGQSEYGVLPSQQWLFPYYYAVAAATSPSTTPAATEPSAATSSELLYTDQATPENFYPETARYRDYFLPQENRWTTPYQSDRGVLLTYYSQIFGSQGNWLGTVVIDVDGTHLSTVLDEPVLRDGGGLILLSKAGDVIANPSNTGNLGTQTYKDIPGLEEIWPQIDAETAGFLEAETGYWAYTSVPERDWLLLAHVPYKTVFGRVVLITLGATTTVGLLLAGMVALIIRYLNQRLQPALAECHRLSVAEGTTIEQLQNKDEIEQLSAAFFFLLERYQQQSSAMDVAIHQRQLLENALVADREQSSQQWTTQVQQWAETTDDVSQKLTEQASAVNTAGHDSREALEASREKISLVRTALEELRQNTARLSEQMQDLLTAANLSAQTTEKHEDIVKVTKAVMSSSLSLLTRTPNLQDPDEIEDKIARFQRFTTRLQELTDQFSQAAIEQRSKKQQIEEVHAYLSTCTDLVNRHLQELASTVEASQQALDCSQKTVNEVAHVGGQVTHSSQQLEELTRIIHRTLQEAIAAAPAAPSQPAI